MKIICGKCRVPLEKKKTAFRYMTYGVEEEIPCCPICGQVFLDEELVRGRMYEAEVEMEDK